MINKIQTKLYFLSLSIFIVLIDQFTKYLMFYNNKLFINKDFLLFKLDFVKNYGAAFNIFSGSRIFLSLISIFFSIVLIYLIFRKNNINSLDLYSYSFILGGTIGNGIDRIYKGYVVDFINLNIINFPVFNIADISINIGFIILLYNIFKNNR
ncbi:signal peptidase II [Prochlorococcus marinus str. MU1404]|uniref:signal peptidase II n=1 Tax=Prochlorococcus marinus TaxID=1219 RepID=UPI001ADC11C4|nr:signal peptidase II [Prochlorococcus marinus]MBO8230080.1 signal peptidase II [Prochlorococcus marinus XMU1404]MBW3073146.1 signal peptidase II [Prochlorococcus marinus str. MU1404]MCR8545583.1 signal peptidase II [Prochlorococcus marinus CUG1432]